MGLHICGAPKKHMRGSALEQLLQMEFQSLASLLQDVTDNLEPTTIFNTSHSILTRLLRTSTLIIKQPLFFDSS